LQQIKRLIKVSVFLNAIALTLTCEFLIGRLEYGLPEGLFLKGALRSSV